MKNSPYSFPFERLADWLGLSGLINFIAFVMFWEYCGGNAFNGHVSSAGEYFVGEYGRLTQVSSGLYRTSWWWTVLLMIHCAAVLALELYQRQRTPEWFWKRRTGP